MFLRIFSPKFQGKTTSRSRNIENFDPGEGRVYTPRTPPHLWTKRRVNREMDPLIITPN